MRISASHVIAGFGPGHGHHGHGRFGHPGMILLCLLVLGGIIALAVVLIADRRRPRMPPFVPAVSPLAGAGAWSPATSAEAILSERFARGEVSVEEFVTARAALRGEWVPSTTPAAQPADTTP